MDFVSKKPIGVGATIVEAAVRRPHVTQIPHVELVGINARPSPLARRTSARHHSGRRAPFALQRGLRADGPRRLAVLLVLLGAVTVAGCEPGPTSLISGLQGRTIVDGGCAVLLPKSPCPDVPIRARITVRTADPAGAIVATVESDGDGLFRLPLAPGAYVVHAANMNGTLFPKASDVQVSLAKDQYQHIDIRFDSGVWHPRA